jgi:hypothetical protein
VKIQPTPTVDPLAAKIADQMRDDTRQLDAFDRRLQQTNPALSPPPAVPTARKRGRPRKNP